MLRLDADTTLNQSYEVFIWLVQHIRVVISISYLSIPGMVVDGRCYISHCFHFYTQVVAFYFFFFEYRL